MCVRVLARSSGENALKGHAATPDAWVVSGEIMDYAVDVGYETCFPQVDVTYEVFEKLFTSSLISFWWLISTALFCSTSCILLTHFTKRLNEESTM